MEEVERAKNRTVMGWLMERENGVGVGCLVSRRLCFFPVLVPKVLALLATVTLHLLLSYLPLYLERTILARIPRFEEN